MINPMDLSGRIIMVTGASSGLGREASILLSQLGAHVILVGRNEEQLNKTLSLMEGDRHYIKPFDLKEVDEIPKWMKAIAAETGPLSGLVHSAGISATLPLRGTSTKKLEEIMRVNFTAAMNLTKAIRLKGIRAKSVSIVCISSVVGLAGTPGLSAYSASKGALISFCRSAAVELANEGIRINSVAPGHVMTEMGEKTRDTLPPEHFKALEAKHPLGFGTPRDVANAVAFLLADTGKWITGTTMVVDGGILTR
ncbi:MAG: SDR family oxidoreductase [Deltaproteobacteria bacterium]|nr:SDR family oxidoreductase [Deltaproteobacteria bacterium]